MTDSTILASREGTRVPFPIRFLLLVIAFLIASTTALDAATVTAMWDPNTEPDIAGYKLSYGTQPGVYTTTVDVGNVTSWPLTLTDGQRYYFVVQAYNTSGALSQFSAEVIFDVPPAGPPSITTLSPTSGPVGASVTITGSNFGSAQGTSTVTFNGTAASPATWSNTSIVVPVPVGATTGNVVVTVNSLASNGVAFTVVPPPNITSLSPTSGAAGTSVTVTGTNFGATQGTSTVKFNGTTATPTSWSATSIVAPVPAGATTGNVVVTVGGVASNGIGFTVLPAPGTITLVQSASIDGAGPTAGLAFSSNNTAGNFIAVAVRTLFSALPITVSDSRGNSYQQAVNFNDAGGGAVAVYYAQNIAGGANTVTVSVSAAMTIRFAILEYGGVAIANALDVTATASQSNTAPNSGNVVTTANGDLLLGVISTQSLSTMTVGSGYTMREVVGPAPSTALMVEDAVQAVAGSASATASLASSDLWQAALVAFRPQSGFTAPTVTTVAPTSGAVGASVTITGTNFGATKGTSTVTFNGTTATTTSWSATSIVAAVPAGATTGNVVVTVGGVASNGVAFTVLPTASITSLSPTSGAVTAAVTITGTNFGATKGASTVRFNGTTATTTSWSATSIVASVPTGATTGNVVVTVGGVGSNGVGFTVLPTASITSLSPTSGAVGAAVTITGTNFGVTKGTSTVKFNGTTATTTSWSATSIVAAVPTGATTGNVVVTVGGVASNGVAFTVLPTASITSLSPTSGVVGASVTITGTNFGATKGTSTVTFNGTIATPTTWAATSIVVPVPAGATDGNVVVTVGGVASNGVSFNVTLPFTDDPLIVGTTLIKAVHITELRSRIDAVRAAKSLAPYAWSDPSLTAGVISIRAQHIIDLRTALTQAYAAATLPPPTYTDPVIGPGVTVKAAHIAEIRLAVKAIE